MPNRGILYMISGTKHLNVLVTSIYSLRSSGYIGPIHIAVGDDGPEDVVRKILEDPRLTGPDAYANITWDRWQAPTGRKGDGWAQKTFMDTLSPFESTVFLDADTIVRGDINPLFTPQEFAVTLTQFSDWKSNGRKIQGRIAPWIDVAPDDVRKMSAKAFPAINTGILSWRNCNEARAFFNEWRSLTAKKPCFINDELAAQLIFWRHRTRVLDSRWNHSPIYDHREDWVITHLHGKKHVNRDQGRAIWLPVYEQCVRFNIADINSWTPGNDKRLREFLCSPVEK